MLTEIRRDTKEGKWWHTIYLGSRILPSPAARSPSLLLRPPLLNNTQKVRCDTRMSTHARPHTHAHARTHTRLAPFPPNGLGLLDRALVLLWCEQEAGGVCFPRRGGLLVQGSTPRDPPAPHLPRPFAPQA